MPVFGFNNRGTAETLRDFAGRIRLGKREGSSAKFPSRPAGTGMLRIIGKPDADITAGSSGTVSIWGQTESGGALQDTGENLDNVFNPHNVDVKQNKFVVIERFQHCVDFQVSPHQFKECPAP